MIQERVGLFLINLGNISLHFGKRTVFDGASLFIPEKARIALVGDNGAGKTTLLRIIRGEVIPDDGAVDISSQNRIRIEYLPQDLVEIEPGNIIAYLKRHCGVSTLEERIRTLLSRLGEASPGSAEYAEVARSYDNAVSAFEHADGYSFDAKARQVLRGLGFSDSDFARDTSELSGGWKMRLSLARILLSRPDCMLLDEPTNHLDTESMEWLEGWLRSYAGTLVVVSHDRMFLDKMVTAVAEVFRGKISLYKGNYSQFEQAKEQELESLEHESESQKERIEHIQRFVDRFRYKASKASAVQSRIKMLERLKPLDAEPSTGHRTMHFHFPPAERSGRVVLEAQSISKRYGEITVFRGVDLTLFRGEKIALVGANGAGKSTLSRLLAGVEEPSEGNVELGINVKLAFFSQESARNLNYQHSVWEEVNLMNSGETPETLRGMCGAFLFSGDDVYKSVSVLSGGEKTRLALLKILLQKSNFLILDEPTNHLDMRTRELFEDALIDYTGTLLLVSHDRHFLDHLVDRVLEVRAGVLYNYPGNYSYFVSKRQEVVEESNTIPNSSGRDMASDNQRRREEAKDQARERRRSANALKALEKRVVTLELEVATATRRKEDLEAALCSPEAHDYERAAKLGTELERAIVTLKVKEEEWLAAMAELEELRSEV